mgnify:CR=1 FL=1
MKKKIIILICLLILLIGCTSTLKPSPKNYEFNNLGNDIDNDQYCFNLCKTRENNPPSGYIYYCEYKIICDGNRCLCKTW